MKCAKSVFAFSVHLFFVTNLLANDGVALLPAGPTPTTPPATVSELNEFDETMFSEMKKRGAVGVAIAVTKNGKLIHTRGFGYADLARKTLVQPTSRFRIASISKPITAVAVLQLVERRKLRLDAKVTDILRYRPSPRDIRKIDPRIREVTVRHLLFHSGGWDRDVSFDPMSADNRVRAAKSLGIASDKVRPSHIVFYMLGQPLDFDPGARHAYSNFGYCVLGRIIESVTRQPYENYVKRYVLAPLGITRMRIGTRTPQQDEVMYYRHGIENAPLRDGQYTLANSLAGPIDVYESHGGWIASAIDLARFASAFDDPNTCKILRPQTIEMMFNRPEGPLATDETGKPKSTYYGMGWFVSEGPEGRAMYHGGRLLSSAAMLYRRPDGLNWLVMYNVCRRDGDGALTPPFQAAADRFHVQASDN